MTTRCRKCRRTFDAIENEEAAVCWTCWNRKKREMKELEDRHSQLGTQFTRLLRSKGYMDDHPQTAPFNDEALARLIRLCHPDKHGNSQAATEATQMLLSLRQASKGEQ